MSWLKINVGCRNDFGQAIFSSLFFKKKPIKTLGFSGLFYYNIKDS